MILDVNFFRFQCALEQQLPELVRKPPPVKVVRREGSRNIPARGPARREREKEHPHARANSELLGPRYWNRDGGRESYFRPKNQLREPGGRRQRRFNNESRETSPDTQLASCWGESGGSIGRVLPPARGYSDGEVEALVRQVVAHALQPPG